MPPNYCVQYTYDTGSYNEISYTYGSRMSYEILRTCMYYLITIKGYIQSNNMIHLTHNETYAMLHKYNSA